MVSEFFVDEGRTKYLDGLRKEEEEEFRNRASSHSLSSSPDSSLTGASPLLKRDSLVFDLLRQQNSVFSTYSSTFPIENKSKGRRYNSRFPLPEKPRQKRAVIQDMVRPLKHWLVRHRHNPYPTKSEKLQLALGSNMTLIQVSNWFANARRRLKNVVQGQRSSWSKRLKLYNHFVVGNAELLSIASDDSIWNSSDEEGEQDERFEKGKKNVIDKNVGNSFISSNKESRTISSSLPNLFPDSAEGSQIKYKSSILQRYLADSVKSQKRPDNISQYYPIRPIPRRNSEGKRKLEFCNGEQSTDIHLLSSLYYSSSSSPNSLIDSSISSGTPIDMSKKSSKYYETDFQRCDQKEWITSFMNEELKSFVKDLALVKYE